MTILLTGLMMGMGTLSGSWAQTAVKGAFDNEMIGNQVIHDEGYGNADAEYYGSKDDLVNDDLTNEQT